MAKKLTPKERMSISRQAMPEQDPHERSTNFREVNLGLTDDLAVTESNRCLSCPKPKCIAGCPVSIKIDQFISLIQDGKYIQAAAKIREDNVLPAVTGRVCPQEIQCEMVCVVGKKSQPVAIGYLERFVADYELKSGETGLPQNASPTGKSVAIVGSGPAGLSCAGDLIQRGHEVTVFEALHEIGGVLVYGIPEFRLPKAIVRDEVENIRKMGVKFEINCVIGKTITVDELMNDEGFDAVFVSTGAGLPRFMDIPGEELGGVYSSNEFLTRVNLMKAYDPANYDQPIYSCKDRNVAVFGGGNTAMDAVRSALRLGAKSAKIIYRRGEKEMPARIEEVHHAKDEGVEFLTLTNPIAFFGNEDGFLTRVQLIKMELGEPDESGRRRPIAIPGSEYEQEIDVAVIAVGTGANPIIQSTTPDMAINKYGYIEADEKTLRTTKRGVFAGGDIVTGGATVILAMGAGRTAAESINRYLSDGNW